MVVFKSPNTIAHTLSLVTIYISLYIVYIVLFLVKLSDWDDNVRGLCYHAEGITIPDSEHTHPYGDMVYIIFTATFLWASLVGCLVPASISLQRSLKKARFTTLRGATIFRALYILSPITGGGSLLAVTIWTDILSRYFGTKVLGNLTVGDLCGIVVGILFGGFHPDFYLRWARRAEESGGMPFSLFAKVLRVQVRLVWLFRLIYQWLADTSLWVLLIAIAQYPVHAYMLFRLRQANQPFLSGDPESSWGFGQVVALVLVAATILDCIRSLLSGFFQSRQSENSCVC
jgi:hypothetical protein